MIEHKAMVKKLTIFGRVTDILETKDFDAITSQFSSNVCQSAFFCNVHMLMLSQEDSALAEAMDDANWVFADGAPIAWLQRRLTGRDAQVVPGYQIILAVCKRAAEKGESVGFLGSTPNVMKKLTDNLTQRFEGLQIPYQYCPPYVQGSLASTQEELDAIKNANLTWLFIGLGCPKQEKWISNNVRELNCHTLGVGAAFDWLSGVVKKPPGWMEKYALAWLYRLLQNPLRMGHRYFKYNTMFILKIIPLLLRRK